MKQYTSNIKKVSVPWDFMERGGQESLEIWSKMVPSGGGGWVSQGSWWVKGEGGGCRPHWLLVEVRGECAAAGWGASYSELQGEMGTRVRGPLGEALLSWRGTLGEASRVPGLGRWGASSLEEASFLFSCCCPSAWHFGVKCYHMGLGGAFPRLVLRGAGKRLDWDTEHILCTG